MRSTSRAERAPLLRGPFGPEVGRHVASRCKKPSAAGQVTPQGGLQLRRKGPEGRLAHTAAQRRGALLAQDQVDGRIGFERHLAPLHGPADAEQNE